MSCDDSASVNDAVFEVLENQMRDGTPPETKLTYDRLLSEGHSHDEVMPMLATVLLCEMNDMVRDQKTFNEARFVAALNKLPELPADHDDDDD